MTIDRPLRLAAAALSVAALAAAAAAPAAQANMPDPCAWYDIELPNGTWAGPYCFPYGVFDDGYDDYHNPGPIVT